MFMNVKALRALVFSTIVGLSSFSSFVAMAKDKDFTLADPKVGIVHVSPSDPMNIIKDDGEKKGLIRKVAGWGKDQAVFAGKVEGLSVPTYISITSLAAGVSALGMVASTVGVATVVSASAFQAEFVLLTVSTVAVAGTFGVYNVYVKYSDFQKWKENNPDISTGELKKDLITFAKDETVVKQAMKAIKKVMPSKKEKKHRHHKHHHHDKTVTAE